MSELAKALVAVQADLPDIGKDKTADVKNNEGKKLYSYKYADLSSISDAVLPILTKNGLAWITAPGLNADGKFVLGYKLLHASGEFFGGEYPLSSGGTPQQQGSAITYARRYALCAMVGVVPEDDDDGAAASRPQPQQRQESSPVAAATQADPETGEKVHNLTKLFMAEVQGADRAKFIQKLEAEHHCQIAKVPDSVLADVEAMIGEWGGIRRALDEASS